MNEKFEEFKEECLDPQNPGATRIGDLKRAEEAERFRNQSEYHMKAVNDLLAGEARLIAVVEGYYAMLHKANQALALAGFKSSSHKCTILGLRGVFQRSELAKSLQIAADERINVDYYMDPESDNEMVDPEGFVEGSVESFREKIDRLIDSEGLSKNRLK